MTAGFNTRDDVDIHEILASFKVSNDVLKNLLSKNVNSRPQAFQQVMLGL